MGRTNRWLLVAACLLGLTGPAQADGGVFFVHEFAGSAQSADQRAIVIFDEGRETLILHTGYEGDAADFAWVVPVPALPDATDIGTVSPEVFEYLYALTEPSGSYSGIGCGCSSGPTSQQFGSVTVWQTLQVDEYEIAVLSANESSDLGGWLDANGYAFPRGHEDQLDYYVDKSWFFVAAKVSAAEPTDAADASLPPSAGGEYSGGAEEMRPLRLSFDTPEAVYPLRISRVSSKDEVELLLYVIARYRMAATNYHTDQVRLRSRWRAGDFASYYEGEFRSTLARAGAGSLLVEFAGPLRLDELGRVRGTDIALGQSQFYVTRLRTYLTPDDMGEDIVMARAGTSKDFSIRIRASRPAETSVYLAGWGLVPGLAVVLGLAPADRRRLIRALLLSAVVVLLII